MVNFGDMTDVTQDANIYQLRTPAPEPESVDVSVEPPETFEEPQDSHDSSSSIILPL